MGDKVLYESGDFKVVVQKSLDNENDLNIVLKNDEPVLYLHNLQDCKDVINILNDYDQECVSLNEENDSLKNEIKHIKFEIDNLMGEYIKYSNEFGASEDYKELYKDKLKVLYELNRRIG